MGAQFRHRTSRAGDPQLHWHVLVANTTCGMDGRWSALDGTVLCRTKRVAVSRMTWWAMVLADDPDTGEVVICSGWGPDADWLHNLHAGPAREVRIAGDRFVPAHRFLTEDEAVAVTVAFRHRHPRRVWLASAVLGWGDLRSEASVCEFVRGHPFVALRPAGA